MTHSRLGLDWSGLQYFIAVARLGSATKAARQLAIDQVTVGRHIKGLEAELGTRLFDRGPRGHVLTSAGEILFSMAEKMEEVAFDGYSKIAGQDAKISGTLRIAAPEGFNTYYLPVHLPAFLAENPDLDVQIVPMSRLHSVTKREADIAITVGQVLEGRAVTRKLSDFTIGLYATEDYLRTREPINSVKDLLNHTVVGYVDDLVVMPDLQYLSDLHPDLEMKIQSASLITRTMLTVHGAGVGLIPHFIAKTMPVLRPILPESIGFSKSYWATVHKDMKDLPRVRMFLNFLIETMRKNPV